MATEVADLSERRSRAEDKVTFSHEWGTYVFRCDGCSEPIVTYQRKSQRGGIRRYRTCALCLHRCWDRVARRFIA